MVVQRLAVLAEVLAAVDRSFTPFTPRRAHFASPEELTVGEGDAGSDGSNGTSRPSEPGSGYLKASDSPSRPRAKSLLLLPSPLPPPARLQQALPKGAARPKDPAWFRSQRSSSSGFLDVSGGRAESILASRPEATGLDVTEAASVLASEKYNSPGPGQRLGGGISPRKPNVLRISQGQQQNDLAGRQMDLPPPSLEPTAGGEGVMTFRRRSLLSGSSQCHLGTEVLNSNLDPNLSGLEVVKATPATGLRGAGTPHRQPSRLSFCGDFHAPDASCQLSPSTAVVPSRRSLSGAEGLGSELSPRGGLHRSAFSVPSRRGTRGGFLLPSLMTSDNTSGPNMAPTTCITSSGTVEVTAEGTDGVTAGYLNLFPYGQQSTAHPNCPTVNLPFNSPRRLLPRLSVTGGPYFAGEGAAGMAAVEVGGCSVSGQALRLTDGQSSINLPPAVKPLNIANLQEHNNVTRAR